MITEYNTMFNDLNTNQKILSFILLTVVTLLTYMNSIQNGFVWDDVPLVVNNPVYKDFANLPVLFKSSDTAFMGEDTPYYRPLNNLTFMIDYRIHGLNPAGYHAENVILHLVAVLLLYILLTMLFSNNLTALLTATLFAVHPINTEVVNMIVSRNNITALVFMLLSFITYTRGLHSHKVSFFLAAGFLFFLSALCKESALMLPLVLFLHDLRPLESLKNVRNGLIRMIPFIFFTAVYLFMRSNALSGAVGIPSPLEGLGKRLPLILFEVPKYVQHILFPLDLSILYSVPENYTSDMLWIISMWAAILLVMVFLLTRKNRAVSFGLLWFTVNFLPVSNIVPISGAPVADRFIYIPTIGLYIIAAEVIYFFYERDKWKRTALFTAVVLVLALSAVTVTRNRDWKDDLSLFKSMVKVQPDHAEGHYNLGSAYMDRGDFQDAEKEWLKTLDIDPGHEGALINLGNLYNVLNKPSLARTYYYRVLASGSAPSVAHYNLALTLEKLGEPTEALRHYEIFLGSAAREFSYLVPKARARLEALRAGHSPPNRND